MDENVYTESSKHMCLFTRATPGFFFHQNIGILLYTYKYSHNLLPPVHCLFMQIGYFLECLLGITPLIYHQSMYHILLNYFYTHMSSETFG